MAYENYDAFGTSLGTAETDEERRRRLEQETLAQKPVAPVAPEDMAPSVGSMNNVQDPAQRQQAQQIVQNQNQQEQQRYQEQQLAQLQQQQAQREAQARAAQQNQGGLGNINQISRNTPTAMPWQAGQPAVAPVNPNQPQQGQPDTYQRMLQAESGNRDYNANGQPVTSPAGAMYAGQVMPSTAKNPGYGIRAAKDDSPEEYNRVGRDMFAVAKQRYGDDAKAAAAYNAGFSRVDNALKQAQATGQDWRTFIPNETKAYLNKVMGGQQVAQAQPGQQAQPSQASQAQIAAANQGGIPAANPMGMDIQQKTNFFLDNQNNIDSLVKLRDDPTTPDYLRKQARDRAFELYNKQYRQVSAQDKATNMIQNGDSVGVANAITSKPKDEEGSYLKMILLSYISPQLAGVEAIKLGLAPTSYKPVMDNQGNTGIVKFRVDGKPLEGVKADGSAMSDSELAAYSSMGNSKDIHVGATPHHGMVNGEVHTFATRTIGGQLQYKDSSVPNSTWSTQAPEGFSTLGYQDPQHVKGLNAAKEAVQRMEKDNIAASTVGGRPLHTQAEIDAEKNKSYYAMTGKPFPGMTAPQATAQAAPQAAVQPTPINQNTQTTNATPQPKAKSMAQSILDGDISPPAGPTTGSKAALTKEVLRLAQEQGRTYNGNAFKIKQEYTTGTPSKTVNSLNTATSHLDTLDKAGQALQNGQIQIANTVTNALAKQLGQPETSNFQDIAYVVGSEVAKAVVGSGQSAVHDREKIEQAFSSSKSPEQLAGTIKYYKELMAGQLMTHKTQWTSSGLNPAEFDAKLLPNTRTLVSATAPGAAPVSKLSEQDNQAIEWARQNPNDPRAAKIKKQLGL